MTGKWTIASTIAGFALLLVIAGPYIAALVAFLLTVAAAVNVFERTSREIQRDIDTVLDRGAHQERWAQAEVRGERRVVPYACEGPWRGRR